MRITALLRGRATLTPDDFARIQGYTVSLHAKALTPILLRYAHPTSAADQQAVEILRQWDGNATGSSRAAAIFEAWFLRFAPVIAGDDLPPSTIADYAKQFSFVTRFLVNTLDRRDVMWCDDIRTEKSETCDDAVTAAPHGAVGELKGRLGDDMNLWRWNAVHLTIFPHQGFDGIRVLRVLLSQSMPNGGDWSTVNVGTASADRPYDQRSVAGYREIIDFSSRNDNRFMIDVGQSDHVLSPHYDDFLRDWQAVKHRRVSIERSKDREGRARPAAPDASGCVEPRFSFAL